ncbi:MAG: hypothetical protein GY906_22485 [bacterium]|nr:hypothetical protein [bacterium]
MAQETDTAETDAAASVDMEDGVGADLIELDDASGTDTDEVDNLDTGESTDAAAGEETAATEATGETAAPAVDDATLQKLATDYALDLNDEKERGILEKIAARESFQQADDTELDILDDLFKEVDGDTPATATEAKPATEAAPPPPASDEPLRFGDIGDSWKTEEDGYNALTTAMNRHAEADEVDRPTAVHAVRDVHKALFARNFMGTALPVVVKVATAIAEQQMTERLEGIAPIIDNLRNQQIHERADAEAEQILRGKFGDEFMEMLSGDEGKPVEINGKRFDPIPFNRILAEYRHIGDIKKEDPDPHKAQLKTFLARYHEAFRIFKREKRQRTTTAKATSDLVKAGAKSVTRTPKDTTRQALNAGGKTSGQLAPKPGEETEEHWDAIREASQGDGITKLFKNN